MTKKRFFLFIFFDGGTQTTGAENCTVNFLKIWFEKPFGVSLRMGNIRADDFSFSAD
jgi:hypothetical protein